MKRSVLSLVAIIVLLSSCQKDKSDDNPGGGSTQDTYQPLTKGSYWKYKQTGTFAGENTIIVTGNKKTMDGIEYVLLEGNNGGGTTGSAYYGVKGNNYYLRAAGVSPNSGAAFDLTQLYLNDKEAAGFTWDFEGGQGNGFAAKIPGKIVERDLSMTVQGKTYKNVIHTQVNLKYDIFGVDVMSFMFYDYYVAKGVGIIKIVSEGDPDMAPGVDAVSELVEYSIK